MAAITTRIQETVKTVIRSFALLFGTLQLVPYIISLCALAIAYIIAPLDNWWYATVPASPQVQVLLLQFLKNIPRVFIFAACCFHVSALIDARSASWRLVGARLMSSSLSIFMFALLNFVPPIARMAIAQGSNISSFVNSALPALAFSIMWQILTFYVLVIIAVDGSNVLRALRGSLKTLRTTWLQAFLGWFIFGALGVGLELLFTFMRRTFLMDYLFDPVTNTPNTTWYCVTSIEYCIASCVILLIFVLKTLLYKRYRAS